MSQDNKFNQYGYNHYLKAPARPSEVRATPHAVGVGMPSRIMRKLRTPMATMVSLALVLALFIGIVVATYPSSSDEQQNIPIIKADLRPLKSQPVQRGGMSIANSESTIMASVGGDIDGVVEPSIENLLIRFGEETENLISKEAALNKAMGQSPMSITTDTASVFAPAPDLVEGTLSDELALNVKDISAKDVLQKIGSSAVSGDSDEINIEFNKKVASAAIKHKPNMPKIYAAATAPDTLDFVRKILDEKAHDVSRIEPAVGAASPAAAAVASGSYFVQLASITNRARAGAEWGKMQARYDVLSGSEFRVQEASLPSGNFYRIQAGPMSKSEAVSMCDRLKAQGKAGGCLVVK